MALNYTLDDESYFCVSTNATLMRPTVYKHHFGFYAMQRLS